MIFYSYVNLMEGIGNLCDFCWSPLFFPGLGRKLSKNRWPRLLCRWQTSAVPLVWFRSLSLLSRKQRWARGSMGSDRCVSGGFFVADAHPVCSWPAVLALLFLFGKMELILGNYSHHCLFTLACLICSLNSWVAVMWSLLPSYRIPKCWT